MQRRIIVGINWSRREYSMTQIEIGIEGMTCASCSGRVERALGKLAGVSEVSVNLATERASVVYDERLSSPAQLVETVRESGYTPLTAKWEIGVSGMTCASCSARVERALNRLPGVIEASVNLAIERANVRYLPATLEQGDFLRAIQEAGYEPRVLDEAGGEGREAQAREAERRAMRRDLVLAGILTLPVLLLFMGATFVPGLERAVLALAPAAVWHWTEAALSSAVLFGPGRRFSRPGWIALRHLSPDMNTLVMSGTGAAWVYSMAVLIVPGLFSEQVRNLYFDSAAVIVTVILFGKYLEAVAKGRTSAAIKKLIGFQAKTVRVLREGREESLPVAQLEPGDLLLVRPGERGGGAGGRLPLRHGPGYPSRHHGRQWARRRARGAVSQGRGPGGAVPGGYPGVRQDRHPDPGPPAVDRSGGGGR
jgi:Cu+-exporting ATPase